MSFPILDEINIEELKKTHETFLLFFFEKDCLYCTQAEDRISDYSPDFPVFKVDIKKHSELAEQYALIGVPAFCLHNEGDYKVLTGYSGDTGFQGWLEYALSHTGSTKAGLLIAHGSKQEGWQAPLEAILEKTQESSRHPWTIAYLENTKPDVTSTIQKLVTDHSDLRQIHVVPLFWSSGKHVHQDISRLLEQAQKDHPEVHFSISSPVGESPLIQEALADLAVQSLK